MLDVLIRRASLWWRFKQLNRTFIPLLEKANAFHDREAVLKLEEQYWYQTACLLEEKRELRRRQTFRQYRRPHFQEHGLSPHTLQDPFPSNGSERQKAVHKLSPHRMISALILLGIVGFLILWTFMNKVSF